MASSYPAGYDTLSNPTASDSLAAVPHADQHANANDAIEAIEAELGLDPAGASATVKARLDAADSALALKAALACLWLPGAASNSVSCPDSAALDIVGDIDIQCRVAMDDWTPGTEMRLVSKNNTGQWSYEMVVHPSGGILLYWTPDGSNPLASLSSPVGVADGAVKWVRVTLDVDNGASGWTARFYVSDDGSTWTLLGSPETVAGVTSIFAGTSTLNVGIAATNGLPAAGKFYRAIVKSGIGGAVVADWRSDIPHSRYRDDYGNVWTVNGTANAWMVG